MDKKEIEKDLLTRGVERIIEPKELKAALASGKKLRVKHGVDPTGPRIHIGRAFQFWKLKQFQDLGHQVVIIVGDFTAQVGDASDKTSERPMLTAEQIKENLADYKNQISKILDMKKVEFRYNSEWLKKLDFNDVVDLAKDFTIAQMISRHNFKERYESGKNIGLHEFLYPLMQGYDSVAIKADIELGGNDQLFNIMAGRKIQELRGMKPQIVFINKLLSGLDGDKMSTSIGNIITILDTPKDMYGKLMSMRDEMIPEYFELTTDVPLDEIKKIKKELKDGANPRDLKARLALEVTKRYHGEKEAQKAAEEFDKVFKDKATPQDIEEIEICEKELPLNILLLKLKLATSKSEARRLVEQGGIKINGKAIKGEPGQAMQLEGGEVVQAGKRKFAKIKLI